MLESVQRRDEQSGGRRQDQGERGLQYDQGFSRKRRRTADVAVAAAKRLNGVDARGHPRGPGAEGDAGDQGDGESE